MSRVRFRSTSIKATSPPTSSSSTRSTSYFSLWTSPVVREGLDNNERLLRSLPWWKGDRSVLSAPPRTAIGPLFALRTSSIPPVSVTAYLILAIGVEACRLSLEDPLHQLSTCSHVTSVGSRSSKGMPRMVKGLVASDRPGACTGIRRPSI